jgi:predicted Zn-dependent protease
MMFPPVRYRYVGFLLLVFGVFFIGVARAQQKCAVPAIPDIPHAHNIFNARQELDLGEIEAELLENSYEVIPDTEFSEHVTAINNRLRAALLASWANIRVVLINTPEANAFSTGTSRIYITQKMIAMLRNDDELAGLLGHELAHVLVHQNAIMVSQVFHDSFGISSVGDRSDIADKFSRMLNSTQWNTSVLQSTTPRMQQKGEAREYEADRFAVYAAAAGGFSPNAYAEFFDRFAATHGRRGNLLTDLFGITTPNERRLRGIHKALHSLPKSCREIPAGPASPEFLGWQAEVMAQPGLTFPKRGTK